MGNDDYLDRYANRWVVVDDDEDAVSALYGLFETIEQAADFGNQWLSLFHVDVLEDPTEKEYE